MRKHNKNYKTSSLSFYRTTNTLSDYFEADGLDDIRYAWDFAQASQRRFYVLGNGSNTILSQANIESVVVKNRRLEGWSHLGGHRYYIGSGALVGKWLRASFKVGLDAPYYLASVPAQIGGALAMNAGRGEANGKTIYDFVEAVEFVDLDSGKHYNEAPRDVVLGHRKTIFTGFPSRYYILGAYLKQVRESFNGSDPIREHLVWARETQDHSGPNCGTVFCRSRGSAMKYLRGMRFGDAQFSKICSNWIINRDPDPNSLMKLIRRASLVSYLLMKKPQVEHIIVD